MTKEFINVIILAGLFLVLFAIGELLHHILKIKADHTRKVVHVGTGLLCMLFPLMLHTHWFVLLLCASFALILFFSLRFNLLRSINGINRVSYGSLLYPAAVYGCFLFYNYHHDGYIYFYLPVLTMALCDPIAASFGKRWPYGKFYIGQDKKTLLGCMAFLISALILTIVLCHFLLPGAAPLNHSILVIGSISLAATFAEALSVKGLDNITIPISVVLVLTLWHV